MKKYLIIILGSILLIACKSNNNSKMGGKQITVSILPQKYFVEKIVGDKIKINVMVPSGASPETYEPQSSQMTELSNSGLYLKIGHLAFEHAWMEKIKATNPSINIIDISQNIELSDKHVHAHHGKKHELKDPHYWVSPRLVKLMSKNILEAIKTLDTANIKYYETNYLELIKEIDSLDQYITNKLDTLSKRNFIIFHPALSYFAEDYKLNQIPIEFEGKSPSPTHIKTIIDEAKAKKISLILVQKQFDIENAQTIAKEINAKVVQIDPLSDEWEKNMRAITDALYENLK